MKCDDIESIYRAYPRHVGKAAAHKAIVKAIEHSNGGRPDDGTLCPI